VGGFAVAPGYADECLTAKSAAQGLIAEIRGSQTEVIHAGPTEVRTALRSAGSTLVELTLFQGLFELERLDQGKRATLRRSATSQKPTRLRRARKSPPFSRR
jgi:hypothetical protein